MRDTVPHFRFRGRIGRGGTIILPGEVAARFPAGQAVLVGIAPADRGAARIRIDEDEVAEIAARQAEPAELVRRCLRAQGAIARKRSTPRRGRSRGTARR